MLLDRAPADVRRRWPRGLTPAPLLAFALGVAVVAASDPGGRAAPGSETAPAQSVESSAPAPRDAAAPVSSSVVLEGETRSAGGPARGQDGGRRGGGAAAPVGTGEPSGSTDAPAPGVGGTPPPSAAAGSTAPGVRDDAIVLGIGVSDLGAIGALGPGYDQGEPQEHIEAVLAQLREDGRLPVHGRDIAPIYRSYSIISADEQRATCEHFANDVEVFAVMALTYFGPGNECSAREYGIPTLTSDGQPTGAYRRSAPNLFSLQIGADRMFRNFVAWADGAGLLTDRRIGVYYPSDPEVAELIERNVIDRIGDLGHDVVARVQTSEAATGGPTDSVAVQQFASNRVDLAILLVSPIAKTNFFSQASAQAYRPTYIENDYSSSTTDTGTSTYPAAHFDGTRAFTAMRYGEANSGLPEAPQAQWCREAIRQQSGNDIPRQGREAEYISANKSCDGVLALVDALERAGPRPTREGFTAAMTEIRGRQAGIHSELTFGPERFDGGSRWRELRWSADCRCWKVVGDFRPLLVD